LPGGGKPGGGGGGPCGGGCWRRRSSSWRRISSMRRAASSARRAAACARAAGSSGVGLGTGLCISRPPRPAVRTAGALLVAASGALLLPTVLADVAPASDEAGVALYVCAAAFVRVDCVLFSAGVSAAADGTFAASP